LLSLATVSLVELNPEAFRAIRLKDGYSLAEAARRLDCTASHLSNIEAGRRGASPSLIKKASVLFGVPMSAITKQSAEVVAS
jgi:transcriptional regulator with XRE-family HTH domain